jgi:hypothetical protein
MSFGFRFVISVGHVYKYWIRVIDWTEITIVSNSCQDLTLDKTLTSRAQSLILRVRKSTRVGQRSRFNSRAGAAGTRMAATVSLENHSSLIVSRRNRR